jgi:hypothetical protein
MIAFKRFKTLFLVNILFANMLFFAICVLFGLKYEQEDSLMFKGYILISSLIVYLMMFFSVMRAPGESYYLLPSGFVLFFGVIFLGGNRMTEFGIKQFLLFVMYAPTSSYVGHCFSKYENVGKLGYWLAFVSSLAALSTIVSLEKMLNLDVTQLMEFYGGGQYQAYSYFAALAFMMIFARYLKEEKIRTSLKIIYSGMLGVLLTGVYLSGGRGGGMVIILGGIYFLCVYKQSVKKVLGIIGLSVVLFLIFIGKNDLVVMEYEYMSRVIKSFERMTSFIDGSGIELEGLSNREHFYLKAINVINENPISGFGIFGVTDKVDEFYAHNLFLDVLMQGGLLYLSIVLMFFGYILVKMVKMSVSDPAYDIIIISAIHSAVMLSVSSSYLIEPLFWFVIGYILSYQPGVGKLIMLKAQKQKHSAII